MINCGTPGDDSYNDTALKIEAFGPVLALVELDYEKEKEDDYLLDVAVPFVNDKSNIFGCLSCNLVSPPSTLKSAKLRKAVENLNYGMIAVNEWVALAILTSVMGGFWGPWGLDKTGNSGRGFVGNHFRIPHIEKMVLYRNLNLIPAFDELAQPPKMFVSDIGFLWATRSSNCLALLLKVAIVLIQALPAYFSEKFYMLSMLILVRVGFEVEKSHMH